MVKKYKILETVDTDENALKRGFSFSVNQPETRNEPFD